MASVFIIIDKETKEQLKFKSKCSWDSTRAAKNAFNLHKGERFDEQSVYKIIELTLQDKLLIDKIKNLIALTEVFCADQHNHMTDGSICISAMRDLRDLINNR